MSKNLIVFIKGKRLLLKRQKIVHKGKYDYSKVEHLNSKTKIIIICPKHGEFTIGDTRFKADGYCNPYNKKISTADLYKNSL